MSKTDIPNDEGWRMLADDEPMMAGDEHRYKTAMTWHPVNVWIGRTLKDVTGSSGQKVIARRPCPKKPEAAVEKPAWNLPGPPAGLSWERTDWTEKMLEGGWRPLLKNEIPVSGEGNDEYALDRDDNFHWQSWFNSTPGHYRRDFIRTRRPLPGQEKPAPFVAQPGQRIQQRHPKHMPEWSKPFISDNSEGNYAPEGWEYRLAEEPAVLASGIADAVLDGPPTDTTVTVCGPDVSENKTMAPATEPWFPKKGEPYQYQMSGSDIWHDGAKDGGGEPAHCRSMISQGVTYRPITPQPEPAKDMKPTEITPPPGFRIYDGVHDSQFIRDAILHTPSGWSPHLTGWCANELRRGCLAVPVESPIPSPRSNLDQHRSIHPSCRFCRI